jgi:hypothetical protein
MRHSLRAHIVLPRYALAVPVQERILFGFELQRRFLAVAQYRLVMKPLSTSYSNFAPRPDYSRGDPHSMVLVRLAGTEVSAGFCTKLAVVC